MTLKQSTKRNSKTTSRQPRARSASPGIVALSPQEAWDLYDQQARELLGMSAEELDTALDTGALVARLEDPVVRRVIMIRTDRPDA